MLMGAVPEADGIVSEMPRTPRRSLRTLSRISYKTVYRYTHKFGSCPSSPVAAVAHLQGWRCRCRWRCILGRWKAGIRTRLGGCRRKGVCGDAAMRASVGLPSEVRLTQRWWFESTKKIAWVLETIAIHVETSLLFVKAVAFSGASLPPPPPPEECGLVVVG
jgi:hypothetical protein